MNINTTVVGPSERLVTILLASSQPSFESFESPANMSETPSMPNKPQPTRISPWADDYPVNTYYLILVYLMCICGLVGNILVIGSVFVHKKLRVLSNVFIVNLAVADLCVVIVVDVFTILGIYTKGLIFEGKPILCELLGVICITSCACSLWCIAAIALNRYICICHRNLYLTLFKKKTVPYIILTLWVISFFIDFPNLIGWGRHGFDQRLLFCTYDFSANFGYSIYFAVLLITIPFIVLTYSYIRILLYSREVKKELRAHQKKDSAAPGGVIRTTDLRLLKSVLIIWICYTLFWLPYTIIVFFDQDGDWGRTVYIFATALAHASSSSNGLIYAATNRNFREAYVYQLKYVFCCCGLFCNDKSKHAVNSNSASTVVAGDVVATGSRKESKRDRSRWIKDKITEPEKLNNLNVMVGVVGGENVNMGFVSGEEPERKIIDPESKN
ncbi:melatonin receptor type 1B-B-like [Amphiura filiformis]|uniref:melatonin receptor type 1B-B-like n=1 Tax=Amphiura filiformis TaxID=82378 RepID=UPI003B22579E